MAYQWTLESSNNLANGNSSQKKHVCPCCNTKNKFVRYVDVETRNYIDYKYGRCERTDNCTYWVMPYGELRGNRMGYEKQYSPKPKLTYSVDRKYLEMTQSNYEKSNLLRWLKKYIDCDEVDLAVSKYNIGISKRYGGSTVFWYVDKKNIIRTGKIIKYDNEGHRVKGRQNWVHAVHSILKMNEEVYEKKIGLFGEHLLESNKYKKVGLVESEKTALICSILKPDILWLATGCKGNLSINKCRCLEGRQVIVYPDLGAYEYSVGKARILRDSIPNIKITVSKYLENIASEEERQKGLDLADFFMKDDYVFY